MLFLPFNVIVSIGTKYFDDWHVVGIGWWLSWVLGLFAVERERET